MPAKGLGDCDYRQRRGAQVRRAARRGLFESAAQKPRHSPAPRRQTGTAAAAPERKMSRSSLSMLAALEAREKQIARSEHMLRGVWRENFERQLLQNLPGTTIVGANAPRLWNTVSALMPEGDAIALGDATRQGRVLPSPPAPPARPARRSRRTCSPRWVSRPRKRTACCVSAAAGKRPKPIGTRWPMRWRRSTPRCITPRREPARPDPDFMDCGGKRSATPLWKLCWQSKSGVVAGLCPAVQNPCGRRETQFQKYARQKLKRETHWQS